MVKPWVKNLFADILRDNVAAYRLSNDHGVTKHRTELIYEVAERIEDRCTAMGVDVPDDLQKVISIHCFKYNALA
jgi:phage-related holin